MMTGVYGTNPQRQAEASAVRAARIESKRAELAARLARLGVKS